MRVEVVTSWSALTAHRQAWSELLQRSSCNVPTVSPLWLDAWWQTFGSDDGRQLRALLIFRGSRLVGLAPLLARRIWYRKVLPLRRIEFVGSGERQEDEICSDYLNIICEAGKEPIVARAVADALVRGALGRWDELVLDVMNGRAIMTNEMIDKLERVGCLVEKIERNPCPVANLPATWDEYLAQLSSNSRSTVRRTLRAVEKWAGDTLEVTRAETPADLERGEKILIDLHGQRWREAGRGRRVQLAKVSRFSSPRHVRAPDPQRDLQRDRPDVAVLSR